MKRKNIEDSDNNVGDGREDGEGSLRENEAVRCVYEQFDGTNTSLIFHTKRVATRGDRSKVSHRSLLVVCAYKLCCLGVLPMVHAHGGRSEECQTLKKNDFIIAIRLTRLAGRG